MSFSFLRKKDARVLTNNEVEQFNVFLEIQLEHYLKFAKIKNLFGLSTEVSMGIINFIGKNWKNIPKATKEEYNTKTRQELIEIIKKTPIDYSKM